jgi:hypothetical protein
MRSAIDYLTAEEIKALQQAAASLAKEMKYPQQENQPRNRTQVSMGPSGQRGDKNRR